jgi:wyosine [tRNA(Phe)-imidazoG37] synthetase (radical SAM superfamily)
MATLSILNHDRNIFNKKYIYPVVSRRAGGLSLGINLNTNNACNWQCIYCEIPNLTRGKPEPIDTELLEKELRFWLDEIIKNKFLEKHTPPKTLFKDIAFSGNGEPTASREFSDAIKIVINVVNEFKLNNLITIRLITNGSYISDQPVQKAWGLIKEVKKEVWFKIDSIIEEDIKIINQINPSINTTTKNIEACIAISPTIIQTCLIKINGKLPSNKGIDKYIAFLKAYENQLKGIHLYSLARPTEQKNVASIERLTQNELGIIADKISKLNLPVSAYV